MSCGDYLQHGRCVLAGPLSVCIRDNVYITHTHTSFLMGTHKYSSVWGNSQMRWVCLHSVNLCSSATQHQHLECVFFNLTPPSSSSSPPRSQSFTPPASPLSSSYKKLLFFPLISLPFILFHILPLTLPSSSSTISTRKPLKIIKEHHCWFCPAVPDMW